MSAIITIRQSQAIHVITDGAAYGEGQEMRFAMSKVWPLPHLSAVIAARGPAGAIPSIIETLGYRCFTFDQLKAEIGPRLKTACGMFEAALALCDRGPAIELIVAGVSETRGLEAYAISNLDTSPHDARHGRDVSQRSWTPMPLGDFALTPGDAAVNDRLMQTFPGGFASPDDIDPIRDGVRILEIQRASKLAPMGAFAQLTSIERQGRITMSVIHRWQDDMAKLKRADDKLRGRVADAWDEADALWEASR